MTSTISILEGNTFVVSDENGDIEAGPHEPSGLFSFDTRFLSKWVLTINGDRMAVLSVDDLHYYEARFFLVPITPSVYANATLSVIRHRQITNGFRETVTLLNHSSDLVGATLRIDVDSDFADLFEVKDLLHKKGTLRRSASPGGLELVYRRGGFGFGRRAQEVQDIPEPEL